MTAATLPADPPLSWRERTAQRFWRDRPLDEAPLELRHHRIYVLPTRRGLAFLTTLLVMILTALNYSLSLGFAVSFLLVGFAASALLHTFRNLSGILVRPITAGEAFAGGTLPFVLSLTGGAGIRRGFTLRAGETTTPLFDIPAGTALAVTVQRAAVRRGPLSLGRITLSSDYPVGLWHAWAYIHFPLDAVVYPAPETSPPPLPPGQLGHEAVAIVGSSDEDLAGVREYRPGDAPQRVAWKTVARGGGWYTKQFDGAGGGGPLLLSWRDLPADLGHEERIARLTAWVLAAESTARPFTLELPGQVLPAAQGRDHRRAALCALALMPAQS